MEKDVKPIALPTKTFPVHTMSTCGILCYFDTGCQAFVVTATGNRLDCSFYIETVDEYQANTGSVYGRLL